MRFTIPVTAALLAASGVALSAGWGSEKFADRVSLGKALFFDTRLSADGSLSCSSCHLPERAFADGRKLARGIHDIEGKRNAPALINVGLNSSLFWDGRESDLERQTLTPIFNPKELGLSRAELERRTGKTAAEVGVALADYLRTIRSTGSPFDRYAAGDTAALNAQELVGLELFRGRAGCVGCHSGPNFMDDRFHNTGVAFKDGRFADDGRFAVTHNNADRGAFRTPTLREVARTAPYMHDGSLATLDDVVEFYAQGGRRNPNQDPRIRVLNLAPKDKRALVDFLKSLSGMVTDGV